MQGKHSGSWPDAERNLVKSEQPYPMSENCLLKVRLGFPCWPLIICVSLGGLVPRACPSPIPLLPTQGSASLPAEGPELPTVPGCLLRIQPGSPQPIHAGQGHNPAMMPLLVKFPWKEIHPHPPLHPVFPSKSSGEFPTISHVWHTLLFGIHLPQMPGTSDSGLPLPLGPKPLEGRVFA